MFESKRFWIYTTFSLLGLNLIVIGVFVFFMMQRPAPPRNEPYDPILNVARRLELSQAQRDSMRMRIDNSQQKENRFKMMELRHDILMENRNPNPNQQKLDSLYSEIGNLQITIEKEMFFGMRQLHDISTPEQRQRYNRMLDRMDRRFKKHRHKSGNKRMGRNRGNETDIDD